MAKTADASTASGNAVNSPTLTMRATQAGIIMGTAGYMAPEQAAGKPVDKRADIWSFGVLLTEMLTGRQMFEGETISHTLAHVLTRQIDFSQIPATTPLVVRELLRRCLDRDLKTRLRDIGEARIAIAKYLADPRSGTEVPRQAGASTTTNRMLPWTLAGALAIAVIVAGIFWWRASRPSPSRPLMRLNVDLGDEVALARAPSGGGNMLAISPDGTRLALTLRGADGKVRLYTRLLHQNQVTPLSGTENAGSPFFSPDGQWIGFAADNKLKKIAVEGGAAVTLCEATAARGASWGDDGNIIVALNNSGGLARVPSAGGAPTPVTKLKQGEATHRWPQVLPGSKAVLFTAGNAGQYDEAAMEVLVVRTGEQKIVHRGGFSPRYVASADGPDHLIYLHESTLFATPFDLTRLVVTGAPVPVLEDASSTTAAGGDFAFSQTGTFVYLTGQGGAQSGWSISWLDNSGKTQPLQAPRGRYSSQRFSPDGKRLAFSMVNGQGAADIWVKDLDRDTPSRLSFLQGLNGHPVWTPDGKHIVFESQSANPGLYWTRSDGSGEAQRLTDGKLREIPCAISPDGKRLAFQRSGVGGSQDIFTAPIEGDSAHPRLGNPELFLGTPFVEVYPQFSTDGRWLAYVSNESGTMEVYVRPFQGPGGRWQISTGGGFLPIWSRNGRELFFETSDQRIMVTGYTASGDSFAAGKPRLWSEVRLRPLGTLPNYDLAPDGKRFAAILSSGDAAGEKALTHLTFLLHFFDELRRRAPSGGK